MGNSKTARGIVSEPWQFSSISDGNPRFGKPSLDNDASTWAKCTFLAYQLVYNGILPVSQGKFTNIGLREFFNDISCGIQFYTSNKTKCTSSNFTSAYYYKMDEKYCKITQSIIKLGNHCYFHV